MYPSSTSSSSHGSMGPPTSGTTNNGGSSGGGGGGLMRYGSAPSAFLSTVVESVIGRPGREFSSLESNHHQHHHNHNHNRQYQPHNFTGQPTRFFPMENSSSGSDQSSYKPSNNNNNNTSSSSTTTTSSHNHSPGEQHRNGQSINTTIGLQRSGYGGLQQDAAAVAIGGSEMVSSTTSTSPLVRHSSSPAGFLNHLAHAASSTDENGFSMTRGNAISRLNSQLSFTRQEQLSQISEENENVINGLNRDREQKKGSHSYATTSYGAGSWEDGNSIMFSVGTSKRDKNVGNDIVNSLSSMETQFQFSMPHTVIEMNTMDNLLNIPQDSVPCKIRAKRGCATHPRSIAERERRTRISGKLKKLQELVPNMDKQTSYADMLDLAVQHIKGLQNQVQKLNKELEHCNCGCKKPRNTGGEEKS